jgi:hypothetical protein
VNTWLIAVDPPADLVARLTVDRTEKITPAVVIKRVKVLERMCPTKGCFNRRARLKTGAYSSYCRDCNVKKNAEHRLRRKAGIITERSMKIATGVCAMKGCNNKRHVTCTGVQISVCVECRQIRDKVYYQKKKELT